MYQALGIAFAGAILIGLLLFLSFYLGFRAGNNIKHARPMFNFKSNDVDILEPIIRTDEDEQELEEKIKNYQG